MTSKTYMTVSARHIVRVCQASRNSQQTRDIVLLLDQRWATVYDAGPALVQQQDNASCLLGNW